MKKTLFILAALLIQSSQVYAYVAAGTGSYLIQIIFAFFVASIFFVKSYWRKIKSFFIKKQQE